MSSQQGHLNTFCLFSVSGTLNGTLNYSLLKSFCKWHDDDTGDDKLHDITWDGAEWQDPVSIKDHFCKIVADNFDDHGNSNC